MQPPNPHPNLPLQNYIDPNTHYHQQHHTANYSYYYPNHFQPPNPNYPLQSISNHDPYYSLAPGNNIINPPRVDPVVYPSQSYSYGYQVQQPGDVVYSQYQSVSLEAMSVSHHPDPNASSFSYNWAVNGATSYATGATLPPNGMHQYVPPKPNSVSLLHRSSKLKGSWKKAPKTKVVQSAWCEVCNVSCDTRDVLDKHKLGKKHMKNLEKLKLVSAPSCVPFPVTSAGSSNPVIGPPENPNKKKTTQLATKVVQSAWCEVCKVHCDTINVLTLHQSGKKHKKNLRKFAGASVPVPDPVSLVASGNPVFGLPVNPGKSLCVGVVKSKKKAAGSLEDLETKRRKVLEGGTGAATVRTCATCNVVCNSETVFQYHLRGQKHIDMMKKLASERISIAAGAM